MWVNGGTHSLVFIAVVSAPTLSISDKESLHWCQAIDRIQLLSCCIFFPSKIGEQQASQIGDIFSIGKLAVDLDVVDDRISGILIHYTLRALFEFFPIEVGPPV